MPAFVPLEIRFWAKVAKAGPDDCWPWLGAKTPQGYGQIGIDQKPRLCTHVALELSGKPRPSRAYALHSCDNPACCNPAHLRWGTQRENMADMWARGRSMHQTKPETIARGDRHRSRTSPETLPRGDRNGSRKHPERVPRGDAHYARTNPEKLARGERNGARTKPERIARGERQGSARLTEEAVRLIRSSTKTHKELGLMFGVTAAAVQKVASRKNWKHVE